MEIEYFANLVKHFLITSSEDLRFKIAIKNRSKINLSLKILTSPGKMRIRNFVIFMLRNKIEEIFSN